MDKNTSFFALMWRMSYIERWGLMRNSKSENIKEHSLDVAMLAHGLAVIKNTYFDGIIDQNKIATMAIFHDASEILTGDLPTPIKYYNTDIQKVYKDVESVANNKILSLLPSEMQTEYKNMFCINKNDNPYEIEIIKAADKLAAYIKCLAEIQSGNNEFIKAKEIIYKALQELGEKMEEVQYFMDHFLQGYTKTLDDFTF